MTKIQKISRAFILLFNILLIALPLMIFFQWIFMDTSFMQKILGEDFIYVPISTPEGYIRLSDVDWTPLSKIIGMVGQSVELLPMYISFFILKSLFKNYQHNEIFNAVNAKYYRYLGNLFFLDALITKPIGGLLSVLAVTITNPPGHRYISFKIGTPSLEAVFCGMLIVMISWIMLEASKLQEEQKFTI